MAEMGIIHLHLEGDGSARETGIKTLANVPFVDIFAKDFADVFPDDVLVGRLTLCEKGLVDNPVAMVRVDHGDEIVDGIHGQPALPDGGLVADTSGNVGKGGVGSIQIPIGGEDREGIDLNPDVVSFLGMKNSHDDAVHRLAGRQDDHSRVGLSGVLGAILVDAVPDGVQGGFSLHLGQTDAKDLFGCGIGHEDGPLGVMDNNTMGQRRDDRAARQGLHGKFPHGTA